MAGLRKLRGKYYVRVFLPGGKEKLLPTKTGDKKRAEAFKRQIEEREFLVRAKLADDVGQMSHTLPEAIEDYLKESSTKHRPETRRTNKKALAVLETCWGNITLKQVTPKHLSTVLQYLSARLSPTTVNIRLRSIRAFLNWAVNTGRLERLPGRITLVKIDDQLPKFFSPDEIDRIFEQVKDPKMKATCRVLAETGLRRSELANCTLDNGYLHLHQTKGRRDRLVILPPDLISDFMLASENPYKPDRISKAFLKAIRSSGVEQKGRTLHCLRHTFALREYYRTGDIYHVKERLGHSAVAVTEVYLRFPQEYLRRVFGDSVSRQSTAELFNRLASEKPAFQA
ncbi:MAG: site-specific integrase [Candidatus Marinimicrobia bacterium]|nr:site-specific integrase [Candidatus Neomarinimicrobiota bacterium]